MQKKPLGLYIHIPFCERKCNYCDFLSMPMNEQWQQEYVRALELEIQSFEYLKEEYYIRTIFIGGGTPSSIRSYLIEKIMDTVHNTFDTSEVLEVTIEANPGTITKGKLEKYKMSGINRLSLGLQSANNEELKMLGRIHTFEQFKENYALAREVGFTNINVDLMSGLPYQKNEEWIHTLEEVILLSPEHISAYSLIIEEGTPFYKRFGENMPEEDELLLDEEDRKLYHETKTILHQAGYERYEISNYAKPGYESKHNLSYWTGIPYLGVGLGASSYIDGIRKKNEEDIKSYLQKAYDHTSFIIEETPLTKENQMEEFMFLGLRLIKGVNKNTFAERFGVTIEQVYGKVIDMFVEENMLTWNGDWLALTERGLDVSNQIMSEFLLD